MNLPDQVSRPEPDLLWLRRSRYRDSHPTAADVQLAVEVAHSSLTYGLENERQLYAEAEIVEYWIVDAVAEAVHVFTKSDASDYTMRRVFEPGETFAPSIAPQSHLDLTELFNG